MDFGYRMFGWGYGVYSCNAGEHLNKIIKTMELTSTNMNNQHFEKIIRNLRIKQFVYPSTIIPRPESTITCGACKETGHNRRNKTCRMHEIHPDITFSDSEDESDM